jgi:hypothetical protein
MSKSVLLLVVLAACAVEPGDGSGTELDDPATETNVPRIAANALSPAMLAYTALTTAQLDGTGAAAMGANASARKVLNYAAGCALDATQTVNFTVGGVNFTLYGTMGMVPAWTSRALTTDEAAWISACVFARVNLTSATITISARGSMSGLSSTSDELASYRVEEGAFWGNAFVDLGSLQEYACNGVDQAANDTYGDLPLRQCAQWDGVAGSNLTPCGFHYAGLCTTACSTTGPYANCSFQGGSAQADVITTFLYGTPP